MNLVNRAMSGLFDVVMTPFELLGVDLALILISGIFGILALILFKFISWQKGIKRTKDRIKGSMIAIRIYQDDLGVVFKSVVSVLLRNVQYLGLNFGPILPLLFPFALVLSQLVVRYAYDPLPVVSEEEIAEMRSGEGTMVTVELKKAHAARAEGLTLEFPEGIVPITPLVTAPSDGLAFVEVAAVAPVDGKIQVRLDGQVVGEKDIVAGDEPTRLMQPRRVSDFWNALILPAEDTFGGDSPIASIGFRYPDRDLKYVWGGELGIAGVFLIASIVFGIAILKPLKIQI